MRAAICCWAAGAKSLHRARQRAVGAQDCFKSFNILRKPDNFNAA